LRLALVSSAIFLVIPESRAADSSGIYFTVGAK